MSLKRTGALFYATKLYSLAVGALFILVVTRNLPVRDFGAWGVITSLLSYAMAATFVNYWTTRLRASGLREATPTALALSLLIATPATAAYFLASLWASPALAIPLTPLMLSTAYVPILYANSAFYSAAYGARPAAAAASEVAFETAKLAAVLALVALWGVDLTSAVAAVLVGHLAQSLALALALRGDLRTGLRGELARRILTLSPISAVSVLPPLISSVDVLAISILSSNEAVAYYTIPLPFMSAVAYSHLLARGLYPSLLSGKLREGAVEEALRMVLLLAVPSAAGVAAIAPNLLYVMMPEYVVAELALRVAAASAAVGATSAVLSDAVQGLERADLEGAPARDVARSRIAKVQLLALARACTGALGVVATALLLKDPIAVATASRASWLAVGAVEFAVLASWARAGVVLKRVLRSFAAYSLAAVAPSALAVAISPWRIREVVGAVAVCAPAYFLLAYLLDPWLRREARLILARLRSSFSVSASQ